jgi:hypothetical protein
MAQSIAQYPNYLARSPASTTSVCKTRTNLLDQLGGLVASLNRAALELASAEENLDVSQYDSAEFVVQGLRNDYRVIRVELERHRAQHGC